MVFDYANLELGEITYSGFGGRKGMVEMIAETSKLDPEEDIKYRDYGIPEIKDILPKAVNGNDPIPKGVLFFFYQIE